MKRLFPLMLLCCFWQLVSAQNLRRQYATQKVNQTLLRQLADYQQSHRKFNRLITNYTDNSPFQERVIPIIFHVLHQDQVERLSEVQIQSQLDALNRDFSQSIRSIGHLAEKREGFDQLQVQDTYIRFCLADHPLAIHYVPTNIRAWTSDNAIKFTDQGGADAIQPDQFLNVWIGKFEEEVSGYAQFPLSPPAIDGIAIDYRFFGTVGTAQAPYNQGKTLSHLVGNYLGLQELWNEQIRCGEDGLTDTPVHNAPNFGCPTYKHYSTCRGYPVEMTMNLMDNTDDACSFLFTKQQAQRMQAVLTLLRPQLAQSSCEPTPFQKTLISRSGVPTKKAACHIYPNPSDGLIQIELAKMPSSRIRLELYNSKGQQLIQQYYPAQQVWNLNLKGYPNGLYFIAISTAEVSFHQPIHLQQP